MKRITFIVALLLSVLLSSAHAARLASVVLKSGESTEYINSHFDAHIGYQDGVEAPVWEYFIPTIYSKSKWLEPVGGRTFTVIPGTDYIDYSKPENITAMRDCIMQWTASKGPNVGVFLDCLNLTAPGYFWRSVDLFREIKRIYPWGGVCVNFGDGFTWQTIDPSNPWSALAIESDAQFCQVAISYGDTRLKDFARLISFATKQVNAGKIVHFGVSDPGGLHAAEFVGSDVIVGGVKIHNSGLIDSPISFNARMFWAYASSTDPKAPVSTQYPKGLPEPEQPLPTGINVDLTPRGPLYAPLDNWWNLDVTNAPVDPNSAQIVAFVKTLGNQGYLHPDFNKDYGISLTSVDPSTPLVPVTFNRYPSESDKGAPGMPIGYPIPNAAKTDTRYFENHEAGCNAAACNGDGHMLLFDGKRFLYELSYCSWDGSKWVAGCGAVFDLSKNYRRPNGWTSTDAAGLAIAPGLIRGDEVFGPGPITHALRFSVHRTNGSVWPASHSGASDAGAPPLGFRIRLKASKDISGYAPEVRKVLQALKTYGGICADRGGSSVNFQGTQDARFLPTIWNPAFHGLHIDDFDVIKLGWQPTS